MLQRWLAGARGKTLVHEVGLDRAENNRSGGDSREKASKGSARIEVWQDFFHASELATVDAVVYFTLDIKLCYRLRPG
ncbi:hypothetical protein Taro_038886 [Colocasia esculenta]|uniref:Uncharacterized protein n=1 Tax=Colocasia esculenta TaxID=4460 RepID=A0A843WF35_COLES|nr:hypothetical protein [Colocasia esculenta]